METFVHNEEEEWARTLVAWYNVAGDPDETLEEWNDWEKDYTMIECAKTQKQLPKKDRTWVAI